MSKRHLVDNSEHQSGWVLTPDRQLELPLGIRQAASASGAVIIQFPAKTSKADSKDALRKILDYADSLHT